MTEENQSEEAIYEKKLQEAFQEGKKMIGEMGERFKPFLEILLHSGVKDVEESTILFGLYLKSRKKGSKGYGIISPFGFSQFLLENFVLQKD